MVNMIKLNILIRSNLFVNKIFITKIKVNVCKKKLIRFFY